MSEKEISVRYRVNVSQTSTGKKSWEATIDSELPVEEILKRSDALVKALELRYPPEIKEK